MRARTEDRGERGRRCTYREYDFEVVELELEVVVVVVEVVVERRVAES